MMSKYAHLVQLYYPGAYCTSAIGGGWVVRTLDGNGIAFGATEDDAWRNAYMAAMARG